MARKLEHRHNNAVDHILLVEGETVIGAWETTKSDDAWTNWQSPGDIADWDATHPDATDPDDYGILVDARYE